jgi:hypothetical protein
MYENGSIKRGTLRCGEGAERYCASTHTSRSRVEIHLKRWGKDETA